MGLGDTCTRPAKGLKEDNILDNYFTDSILRTICKGNLLHKLLLIRIRDISKIP